MVTNMEKELNYSCVSRGKDKFMSARSDDADEDVMISQACNTMIMIMAAAADDLSRVRQPTYYLR